MSEDTKRIERQCVGGSVRKLNRMVTAIYDNALANAGLKTSQFSVLVSVANRDPRNLRNCCKWTSQRSAAMSNECAPGVGSGSSETRIAEAI
jgi:hypothetical protein